MYTTLPNTTGHYLIQFTKLSLVTDRSLTSGCISWLLAQTVISIDFIVLCCSSIQLHCQRHSPRLPHKRQSSSTHSVTITQWLKMQLVSSWSLSYCSSFFCANAFIFLLIRGTQHLVCPGLVGNSVLFSHLIGLFFY